MNSKTKISVIIPTYNEETNIKETLINVRRQICNFPYEIIVADGQSIDKTVSIAEKYAKVYVTPKKGKTYQLNHVVPESSGELLVFLDADTIIDPYFLHNINKIFKRKKNLIACSARVKYYNGKAISFKLGSIRFNITSYFFLNLPIHIFYVFKTLLKYPELIGCNMIVRRDIFYKVGGFKQPPSRLIGGDKLFTDALIYHSRKMKKGNIKSLNLISVLTSGRFLNTRRSLGRIAQYHSQKDIINELAKDTKWTV